MDCELRIKPADNGFVMEYADPEVRANNHKDDTSYQDPWRQRVYATIDELKVDLDKLLPVFAEKAKQPETAHQNFNTALAEALSGE